MNDLKHQSYIMIAAFVGIMAKLIVRTPQSAHRWIAAVFCGLAVAWYGTPAAVRIMAAIIKSLWGVEIVDGLEEPVAATLGIGGESIVRLILHKSATGFQAPSPKEKSNGE